jgi:hypothetical protein
MAESRFTNLRVIVASPLSFFFMVILLAGLRHRHMSETRIAVCLILGPVFVLWQEGVPESSDQSIRLLQLA